MSNPNTLPLPSNRTYYFNSEFSNESCSELNEFVLSINSEDAYLSDLYTINGQEYTPPEINIYIDSYGGAVLAMRGTISIIEASNTTVNTIAVGACCSCGFFLLLAGHNRYAYKRASIMYHPISSESWGQVQDMEESHIETKRLQEEMEDFVVEKTDITKATLEDIRLRKFDWYMTSEEAFEHNVIDEII